jgi:hypothetical protein
MAKKKNGEKMPPFVGMLRGTIETSAWRAMSHGARSLFLALKARYNSGHRNNGRIYLSQRAASKEIGSSFEQIARWFRELQHFGFIVMTKGGSLGVNGKGTAPHWRLTELGYMNDLPTKDFLKWDGTEFKDQPRPRRKQNPVAENRNTSLRESATLRLRKAATLPARTVAGSRNMVGLTLVAESRNVSSLPLPAANALALADPDTSTTLDLARTGTT